MKRGSIKPWLFHATPRRHVQRQGSNVLFAFVAFSAPLSALFLSLMRRAKVNASPSLSAENAADRNLKSQLISDVLDVVDLEGRLAGDEQR